MIKFRYRKEFSQITGTILRPVAEIFLEAKGKRLEVAMYIDSGADICMIPLHLGKALGFRQSAKDEILEIKGVSGSGVPYILKRCHLVLNHKRIPIRLAWALIDEVPLLLGRLDIFPKFKITFDEKAESIIFNPHS
jgi:hypothetical protein